MECGGFLYLYGGTCNEFTLEHVRGIYKLDTSSFTWYEVGGMFIFVGVMSFTDVIHVMINDYNDFPASPCSW